MSSSSILKSPEGSEGCGKIVGRVWESCRKDVARVQEGCGKGVGMV